MLPLVKGDHAHLLQAAPTATAAAATAAATAAAAAAAVSRFLHQLQLPIAQPFAKVGCKFFCLNNLFCSKISCGTIFF